MYAKVADLVTDKFVPALETGRNYRKNDRPLTLYSAVMECLGLGFTDSVLSARNHNQIVEALGFFYEKLDEVTGTRSQVWAMQSERTEVEVLDALRRAAERFPTSDFDNLVADIRIGIHKVAGRGKHRGAVAVEATRVAHLTGRQFVEVIGNLFAGDPSDADALAELESIPGEIPVKGTNWKPAAAWSIAYNDYLALDPEDLTLAAFCRWLSDDWSTMSDAVLAERKTLISDVQVVEVPA